MTEPGKAVEYIQHTKAGSAPARAGEARWTLVWTAPTAKAPVQFDIAANASNNDNSPLGDFIYSATLTARPDRPAPMTMAQRVGSILH